MPRDDLEHGWLVCGVDRGSSDAQPKKVGKCAWCGQTLYEDEDFETYGYNEAGELLCLDCYEESRDNISA